MILLVTKSIYVLCLIVRRESTFDFNFTADIDVKSLVVKQLLCSAHVMVFTGSGSLQNSNEKDGNRSPSCARGLQAIRGETLKFFK